MGMDQRTWSVKTKRDSQSLLPTRLNCTKATNCGGWPPLSARNWAPKKQCHRAMTQTCRQRFYYILNFGKKKWGKTCYDLPHLTGPKVPSFRRPNYYRTRPRPNAHRRSRESTCGAPAGRHHRATNSAPRPTCSESQQHLRSVSREHRCAHRAR